MVSVFPELESVESAAVDTSDDVGLVLITVEDRLAVSPADDVSWDTVWAGVEPLGEAENIDVVTAVCVV